MSTFHSFICPKCKNNEMGLAVSIMTDELRFTCPDENCDHIRIMFVNDEIAKYLYDIKEIL